LRQRPRSPLGNAPGETHATIPDRPCLRRRHGAGCRAGAADDVVFCLSNIALTFSAAYLGEDHGFFAKNGLKVKGVIQGPGATNAVFGSADFALASTVV
jgi:ABC-type nitrate/sulfonate/bicarbonate transport system substrate-binding protein